MNLYQEILEAKKRITPYLLKTPLLHSIYLSKLCGGNIFLKMESEQYTGSFKARGSLNKVLFLKEKGQTQGIITASTGNHGMGVARALAILNMEGKVVIPTNTVSTKVEALKNYGVELEQYGDDCFISEQYAQRLANTQGGTYISPYNDPQVIGGQGTIGIEIMEQCPSKIDNVYVTIGGGGLISGIATYLKTVQPDIRIIGCQPENSPEMTLSVRSNSYQTVPFKDTLSDASAGAFEEASITYPICQQLIDDFILIAENEIAKAIRLALAKERKLIEGSAAVALAALLKNKERLKGQTSVIVICGGNIALDKLQKVLIEGFK